MVISEICKKLQLEGNLVSYDIVSNGNINTTYHVLCNKNGTVYEYLLQRINKNVFKDPIGVMNNIATVSDYISKNSTANELNFLVFNKTEEGLPYVIDELDNFWRCCQYLDCITFNTTDNLNVIEEAGYAFGKFQQSLQGFNANKLAITIPDFHNTIKRIENLETAIKFSGDKRKTLCQNEIDYILQNKDLASILQNMFESGELPLRVTHNDTKCNNVVFNKNTLKALAVIDLDTIMPGLTAYDFGDGARSIACTTEEDEKDLSKVKFDLDKFESFAKGYLAPLKTSLNKNEIKTLGVSCFVLTIELAARFLEDYLNGDIYFKIAYEDQNLYRTKCQIALCKDIYSKLDKINEIINKYSV